jgi:hypothetical protein
VALVERSQVTWISRIDLDDGKVTALVEGPRFDYDVDVARDGRIVVLGGDDAHPYRISPSKARPCARWPTTTPSWTNDSSRRSRHSTIATATWTWKACW